MNPELKKGIRKLRLMKILRTDPKKIYQEGEKYFCFQCGHKLGSKAYGEYKLPNDSDEIVFIYRNLNYGFEIYYCWTPK